MCSACFSVVVVSRLRFDPSEPPSAIAAQGAFGKRAFVVVEFVIILN